MPRRTVLIMLLALSPVPLLADGKAWRGDWQSLRPLEPREQRAVILHRDGRQRMLIAVNIHLDAKEKALWVFPVPGRPDQAKIDLVDSFPALYGQESTNGARQIIDGICTAARATQIYPLIIDINRWSSLGAKTGVVQHEGMDKWGIHAETVTAGSAESLVEYLKEKGVSLPKAEAQTFSPYFSKEHVLVLVWISSTEEVRKRFPAYEEEWNEPGEGRWPCLYVEFPTDRAFYPLKPTSSYGSAVVPVSLAVIGYVKPQTSPDLLRRTRVSYFRYATLLQDMRNVSAALDRHVQEGEALRPLGLMGKEPDLQYTRIKIDVPARELTDDLWFVPHKPAGVAYAERIESLGKTRIFICLVVAITAVLSYVSAGLTGLVLFNSWRGYARVGLWNVLTIVGFFIATRLMKGERGENLRKVVVESPTKMTFCSLFSITFVLLTIIAQVLLSLPMWPA